MQKRFTNRFDADFDLAEDAMDGLLPRLILQPIMENALIHGLLYCEKPNARLHCRAWHDDNSLIIEVEDNGSGMNHETLERLWQDNSTGGHGVGLSNVRKRLRLFGGSDASITIHSQAGVGTCVSLVLPFTVQSPEETTSILHGQDSSLTP